jgi:hypothetical protein
VFSSSLLQSQNRLKSHSDFPSRINITAITTAAAAGTTTTNTTTITINTNPAAAIAAITTVNSTGSNHEEYTKIIRCFPQSSLEYLPGLKCSSIVRYWLQEETV